VGSIPESAYAWMRYFVMFDPSDLFGSIKCPVLALNGEKDCQVVGATYRDTLQCRDGQWKIQKRKVQIHYFNPIVGTQLASPQPVRG